MFNVLFIFKSMSITGERGIVDECCRATISDYAWFFPFISLLGSVFFLLSPDVTYNAISRQYKSRNKELKEFILCFNVCFLSLTYVLTYVLT